MQRILSDEHDQRQHDHEVFSVENSPLILIQKTNFFRFLQNLGHLDDSFGLSFLLDYDYIDDISP